MINKVYEHLKTKKKYNTLKLKYDVKCDELQEKIVELNTEKRIKLKQQQMYDEKISELQEENIKLKESITELKKENKRLKNEMRKMS